MDVIKMRPETWRRKGKEGPFVRRIAWLYLISLQFLFLTENQNAMGQRLQRFAECTALPCPPCFSLWLCFGGSSAERPDGGSSKCLRANVSLFLQIHAVDVEHGLQEALHSRATKHSDHQDLLLSFFSPFMSPSTGPNKSPCKTNS